MTYCDIMGYDIPDEGPESPSQPSSGHPSSKTAKDRLSDFRARQRPSEPRDENGYLVANGSERNDPLDGNTFRVKSLTVTDISGSHEHQISWEQYQTFTELTND